MKSNVPLAQASAEEVVLPERVQEALGQLVGSAKEGLLALSVGVGLGVLSELLEEEVVEVVGARGKHDPERTAVRHGHESGEVTLGGRRVAVDWPRVRSADGRDELPLETYAHFGDRDPLTKAVLGRLLAGVSTRRYRRTQEPVGSQVERAVRSTSRSSVSRTFVEPTRRSLSELMGRRLGDVRPAVMMIYGLELQSAFSASDARRGARREHASVFRACCGRSGSRPALRPRGRTSAANACRILQLRPVPW